MSKIVHIIKPEHKRIFYSFLKANNALEQFKRNCRYRGREEEWLISCYNYYLEEVIDLFLHPTTLYKYHILEILLQPPYCSHSF